MQYYKLEYTLQSIELLYQIQTHIAELTETNCA